MNEADHFKSYLGDGVYAEFDGFQIWLTTLEDMRIAIEPPVLSELNRYWQAIVDHYEAAKPLGMKEP